MNRSKLAIWADAVRQRDGKCVDCGRLEDLHAHHIKPKSSHPELALVLDNGKTLCYRCHKAEHERNRPVRVRSNKPQRRTMERLIEGLQEQVRDLTAQTVALRHKVKVCERGACKAALRLIKI